MLCINIETSIIGIYLHHIKSTMILCHSKKNRTYISFPPASKLQFFKNQIKFSYFFVVKSAFKRSVGNYSQEHGQYLLKSNE